MGRRQSNTLGRALGLAVVTVCAVLLFIVLCGVALAAALQSDEIRSADVAIRRWSRPKSVPQPVQLWANHSTAPLPLELSGRRVVVVGNAPTIRNMGATIDSFDVVVRVNPPPGGHKLVEHRGQRASVLHINSNMPPRTLASTFRRYPDAVRVWSRSRKESVLQLGLRYWDSRIDEYDARRMVREHAELRECGPIGERFLTAGMLAVLHALALGSRRPLSIAGISAYVATGHAAMNDSAYHQRNLMVFHCIDVERRLLQRLVREGAVVVECEAARLFGA